MIGFIPVLMPVRPVRLWDCVRAGIRVFIYED